MEDEVGFELLENEEYSSTSEHDDDPIGVNMENMMIIQEEEEPNAIELNNEFPEREDEEPNEPSERGNNSQRADIEANTNQSTGQNNQFSVNLYGNSNRNETSNNNANNTNSTNAVQGNSVIPNTGNNDIQNTNTSTNRNNQISTIDLERQIQRDINRDIDMAIDRAIDADMEGNLNPEIEREITQDISRAIDRELDRRIGEGTANNAEEIQINAQVVIDGESREIEVDDLRQLEQIFGTNQDIVIERIEEERTEEVIGDSNIMEEEGLATPFHDVTVEHSNDFNSSFSGFAQSDFSDSDFDSSDSESQARNVNAELQNNAQITGEDRAGEGGYYIIEESQSGALGEIEEDQSDPDEESIDEEMLFRDIETQARQEREDEDKTDEEGQFIVKETLSMPDLTRASNGLLNEIYHTNAEIRRIQEEEDQVLENRDVNMDCDRRVLTVLLRPYMEVGLDTHYDTNRRIRNRKRRKSGIKQGTKGKVQGLFRYEIHANFWDDLYPHVLSKQLRPSFGRYPYQYPRRLFSRAHCLQSDFGSKMMSIMLSEEATQSRPSCAAKLPIIFVDAKEFKTQVSDKRESRNEPGPIQEIEGCQARAQDSRKNSMPTMFRNLMESNVQEQNMKIEIEKPESKGKSPRNRSKSQIKNYTQDVLAPTQNQNNNSALSKPKKRNLFSPNSRPRPERTILRSDVRMLGLGLKEDEILWRVNCEQFSCLKLKEWDPNKWEKNCENLESRNKLIASTRDLYNEMKTPKTGKDWKLERQEFCTGLYWKHGKEKDSFRAKVAMMNFNHFPVYSFTQVTALGSIFREGLLEYDNSLLRIERIDWDKTPHPLEENPELKSEMTVYEWSKLKGIMQKNKRPRKVAELLRVRDKAWERMQKQIVFREEKEVLPGFFNKTFEKVKESWRNSIREESKRSSREGRLRQSLRQKRQNRHKYRKFMAENLGYLDLADLDLEGEDKFLLKKRATNSGKKLTELEELEQIEKEDKEFMEFSDPFKPGPIGMKDSEMDALMNSDRDSGGQRKSVAHRLGLNTELRSDGSFGMLRSFGRRALNEDRRESRQIRSENLRSSRRRRRRGISWIRRRRTDEVRDLADLRDLERGRRGNGSGTTGGQEGSQRDEARLPESQINQGVSNTQEQDQPEENQNVNTEVPVQEQGQAPDINIGQGETANNQPEEVPSNTSNQNQPNTPQTPENVNNRPASNLGAINLTPQDNANIISNNNTTNNAGNEDANLVINARNSEPVNELEDRVVQMVEQARSENQEVTYDIIDFRQLGVMPTFLEVMGIEPDIFRIYPPELQTEITLMHAGELNLFIPAVPQHEIQDVQHQVRINEEVIQDRDQPEPEPVPVPVLVPEAEVNNTETGNVEIPNDQNQNDENAEVGTGEEEENQIVEEVNEVPEAQNQPNENIENNQTQEGGNSLAPLVIPNNTVDRTQIDEIIRNLRSDISNLVDRSNEIPNNNIQITSNNLLPSAQPQLPSSIAEIPEAIQEEQPSLPENSQTSNPVMNVNEPRHFLFQMSRGDRRRLYREMVPTEIAVLPAELRQEAELDRTGVIDEPPARIPSISGYDSNRFDRLIRRNEEPDDDYEMIEMKYNGVSKVQHILKERKKYLEKLKKYNFDRDFFMKLHFNGEMASLKPVPRKMVVNLAKGVGLMGQESSFKNMYCYLLNKPIEADYYTRLMVILREHLVEPADRVSGFRKGNKKAQLVKKLEDGIFLKNLMNVFIDSVKTHTMYFASSEEKVRGLIQLSGKILRTGQIDPIIKYVMVISILMKSLVDKGSGRTIKDIKLNYLVSRKEISGLLDFIEFSDRFTPGKDIIQNIMSIVEILLLNSHNWDNLCEGFSDFLSLKCEGVNALFGEIKNLGFETVVRQGRRNSLVPKKLNRQTEERLRVLIDHAQTSIQMLSRFFERLEYVFLKMMFQVMRKVSLIGMAEGILTVAGVEYIWKQKQSSGRDGRGKFLKFKDFAKKLQKEFFEIEVQGVYFRFARLMRRKQIKTMFRNMFLIFRVFEENFETKVLATEKTARPLFYRLEPLMESFLLFYKMLCNEDVEDYFKQMISKKVVSNKDLLHDCYKKAKGHLKSVLEAEWKSSKKDKKKNQDKKKKGKGNGQEDPDMVEIERGEFEDLEKHYKDNLKKKLGIKDILKKSEGILSRPVLQKMFESLMFDEGLDESIMHLIEKQDIDSSLDQSSDIGVFKRKKRVVKASEYLARFNDPARYSAGNFGNRSSFSRIRGEESVASLGADLDLSREILEPERKLHEERLITLKKIKDEITLLCKKGVKMTQKVVNHFIASKPKIWTSNFFALIRKFPAFISFENKRKFFKQFLMLINNRTVQRITIDRFNLLQTSFSALRHRSRNFFRGKLVVSFKNEEGEDAGGVAREWFLKLSLAFLNSDYNYFRPASHGYAYHPSDTALETGADPGVFKFVGRVVGKALFDGHYLDAHFTRAFYKQMVGRPLNYSDFEDYDPQYFKNLKWLLENDPESLGLTFTVEETAFGVSSEVELKPGGATLDVTQENKLEYVDLLVKRKLLDNVRNQVESFLAGLYDVVPPALLKIFSAKEIELMISGLPEINIKDLEEQTEYNGYTKDSQVIKWFWKTLRKFDTEMKAGFLQFVTGTSKVPLEGFGHLKGMGGNIQRFQIHKSFNNKNLPTSHTCMNQLDLPEYPTEAELLSKLSKAIEFGKEGFGFV